MKKTVTVNIGGLPFTLDDDAHTVLAAYLSQIERRVSPMERAEVMEDVEMRIANLLSSRLSYSIQVINVQMVREVMQTIGSAEAFGEEQPNGSYQSSSSSESSNNSGSRLETEDNRFYRSRSNKVFGGLCGAIAPKLGLDVSVVRLLVVLLVIFSVSALFWFYIIAWIVIPEEPVKGGFRNERR